MIAEIRKKQRESFQRTVMQKVLAAYHTHPEIRLRRKLKRFSEHENPKCARGWCLPDYMGVTTARVLRNLQRLPKLVPPRVCGAVIRTLFNGWTTHRRFQRRHLASNICCFECRTAFHTEAEDSLEHYCKCPVVLNLLRSKLRVEVARENALRFWLLDILHATDDLLRSCAVHIYACYMTYNMCSHSHKERSVAEISDAVGQHLIQSVRGHPALTRWLDDRWRHDMLHPYS